MHTHRVAKNDLLKGMLDKTPVPALCGTKLDIEFLKSDKTGLTACPKCEVEYLLLQEGKGIHR